MTRHSFAYHRPTTVDAVVDRLQQSAGNVAILAGGTDLIPQLRSRLVQPAMVLDIKGVNELSSLEHTEQGLSIGATVVLNRLLEQQPAAAGYGALVQAVAQLASYPIRNRATLVGNVSNASPCADSVPPLCVLGAEVELRGPQGARRLPVQQFIVGNRETQLAPGELVARVVVPPPGEGSWSGFIKRKRVRGHDLALASVALLRDPAHRQLRLAVGSCSAVPTVLDLDAMFDAPDAQLAAQEAMQVISPIDDVRASIEYRRDMVGLMARRLFAALARGEG